MKVKTILVPTDFSKDAERAVQTAADLAKTFDAKLVLLHSYHVEIPMVSAIEGPYTLPPNFYPELTAQATDHIEKVAQELASKEGIETAGVALAEPVAIAILGKAEALPADLIVMGTRGLSGFKHVVLGSVAERIVRMAPCPVLTVKAES